MVLELLYELVSEYTARHARLYKCHVRVISNGHYVLFDSPISCFWNSWEERGCEQWMMPNCVEHDAGAGVIAKALMRLQQLQTWVGVGRAALPDDAELCGARRFGAGVPIRTEARIDREFSLLFPIRHGLSRHQDVDRTVCCERRSSPVARQPRDQKPGLKDAIPGHNIRAVNSV